MVSPLHKIFDYGVLKYQYYDTPEGKDCDKKIIFLTSRAAFIGVGVSAYTGVLNSKVIGIPNHLMYIAKWSLPVTAIAGAYGIGTCLAVSARKQDDLWNNAVGAALAGSMAGAWQKMFGLGVGTFFVVMGLVIAKKKAMQYNLHDGNIYAPPKFSGGPDRLFHYENNPNRYDGTFLFKDRETK